MCKKLSDIINTAFKVLDNHVEEHMYFNNMCRQEASQDFINKYFFAIRETYCELCEEKNTCEEYKDYVKYQEWNFDDTKESIIGELKK